MRLARRRGWQPRRRPPPLHDSSRHRYSGYLSMVLVLLFLVLVLVQTLVLQSMEFQLLMRVPRLRMRLPPQRPQRIDLDVH